MVEVTFFFLRLSLPFFYFWIVGSKHRMTWQKKMQTDNHCQPCTEFVSVSAEVIPARARRRCRS
jgi:hypothetical protein